jgi:hypothetical protein
MLTIDKLTKTIQQLLNEFRSNIFLDSKKEEDVMRVCMKEINQAWDKELSAFPERKKKKGSVGWKLEKSDRSKHLISIIKRKLLEIGDKNNIIINPACYTGQRARQIAEQLPNFKIIGTDIDPKWNKYWHFFQKINFKKEPKNYKFIKDNIFESKLNLNPEAVVFFGACGSVTDAIMDYAIKNESPILTFRTCCHDNIGGNTVVKKKKSLLNLFFRYKNNYFTKRKEANKGDYFSSTYSKNSYPRSNAVKKLSTSEEYEKIAQNSVDSEICEALIDLDRCCYLIEHDYEVLYKDELFFAERI